MSKVELSYQQYVELKDKRDAAKLRLKEIKEHRKITVDIIKQAVKEQEAAFQKLNVLSNTEENPFISPNENGVPAKTFTEKEFKKFVLKESKIREEIDYINLVIADNTNYLSELTEETTEIYKKFRTSLRNPYVDSWNDEKYVPYKGFYDEEWEAVKKYVEYLGQNRNQSVLELLKEAVKFMEDGVDPRTHILWLIENEFLQDYSHSIKETLGLVESS